MGQDVESRDYAYTIYSPLLHVIASVVSFILTLRMYVDTILILSSYPN